MVAIEAESCTLRVPGIGGAAAYQNLPATEPEEL